METLSYVYNNYAVVCVSSLARPNECGAHCQDQERTKGRLSRGIAQVGGNHDDAEAQSTAEKCRTMLKLRCAAARDQGLSM